MLARTAWYQNTTFNISLPSFSRRNLQVLLVDCLTWVQNEMIFTPIICLHYIKIFFPRQKCPAILLAHTSCIMPCIFCSVHDAFYAIQHICLSPVSFTLSNWSAVVSKFTHHACISELHFHMFYYKLPHYMCSVFEVLIQSKQVFPISSLH